MLEIDENAKISLPMDLLRRVHKLSMETHSISDVKTSNNQVNKLPRELVIGMNIYK